MIVHLNGSLMPVEAAHISPFDRGFLFGDGVYEGLRSFGGEVICAQAHADRMKAGLASIQISGFDPDRILSLSHELLSANELRDGFVYWQITRGVSRPRKHVPQQAMTPTVFGYAVADLPLDEIAGPAAFRVVTRPDVRWLRCDVKGISLLPVVMGKMAAAEEGANEVVFIRGDQEDAIDSLVTEGGSTNIFFVFDRGGRSEIVTPPADNLLLQGITRDLLLHVQSDIVERTIHASEIDAAREIILTGTSTLVAGVVELDGRAVGAGTVGPVARLLFDKLVQAICDGNHEKVTYRA